jgi:hypothetical protein
MTSSFKGTDCDNTNHYLVAAKEWEGEDCHKQTNKAIIWHRKIQS